MLWTVPVRFGAHRVLVALAFALAWGFGAAPALPADFDLVLVGGRVIDPESGLDAIRNVGITNGRIAAVSTADLNGAERLDVSGLVVAPGFIDLHAHGQSVKANRYQARDGVTTALDLEGGFFPVEAYYERRKDRALLNYGVSVSHHLVRQTIWPIAKFGDKWAYQEASPAQMARILALFTEGLAAGGIGAGLALEYTPGVGYDEVYEIFRLMAARHAPVTVHVRRARGTRVAAHANIAAIEEVLADAVGTGATLHIVHITSSAVGDTDIALSLIAGARRLGIPVTTEVYPYTAGSTNLGSAAFDQGWQKRLGMSYGDLQWAATGERLTRRTFEKYRSSSAAHGGADVIAHFIPKSAMRRALADPMVQIASDGLMWKTGGEHPRGAGTFARVLGRYAREEKLLGLDLAIAKMTLMPAQRLAPFVPAMARKGRIKVGADADITVFDAEHVIDRATYEKPMQFSTGIKHVLVGGVFIVRDQRLVDGVLPGQPIRMSGLAAAD